MTPSDIDHILGEFIDAWHAGQRPDIAAFVARAEGKRAREELTARLATWLEIAPTPAYDAGARAQIAQEPALRAALQAAALAEAPLPARLVALRERAGLAVRDVAQRLVAVFDLDDAARAESYLARVERAELDGGRLSRRLLDALAAILGADRDLLTPLGLPAPMAAPAAPAQAFFRSAAEPGEWVEDDIDALSRAALAPAPPPPDELDRLFLGGPDA